MVVKDGVEFDALDGQPVTLMFLIAAPNTKDNVHLDVLSKLSVLMMDEVFADALRNAKSADEFLDIIDKADAEQGDIDERLADMNEASANGFKILAVTSCPTGIAHTYMAAEGESGEGKRLFREDRDERLGRSEKRSYRERDQRSGLYYCSGRRASSDGSF